MNALSRNLVIKNEWKIAKQHGKTRAEFAAWLGVGPKALDSILYRANQEEIYNQTYEPVDMGEPLYIMGDAIVIGDVHIPYHNLAMISRACSVGARLLPGQRNLIIAGDLLNLDKFSSYLPATELPSWQAERDATRKILGILGDNFDHIYWLMGNHERRFSKATGMWAEDLVDLCVPDTMRSRLDYSPFGWCVLDSNDVRYRITHPKQYSRTPGKLGNNLAAKYDMNIISFHEHHLGMVKASYGGHIIINGGCMVDQERLAYATLDDSDAPDMALGFVSVINGYPSIYDDGQLTDWSAL